MKPEPSKLQQDEGTRTVRAMYTDSTITVYQAYSPHIADGALRAGTFVAPFKRDRMTWIKPSFLWMMYRSGWASKSGQERVLAVELSRVGFEWALRNSSLTHYDPEVHPGIEEWSREKETSPVRVQWDPERSVDLEREPHRAIQIGLSGEAVDQYLDDWIVSISDMTDLAHTIEADVLEGNYEQASAKLPREALYPLPAPICRRIGADPTGEALT